jgi:glycosyltransferase involved in cell wall biosynthesis
MNWAYDSIAKALVKQNKDPDLNLDIAYVKGGQRRLKDIHREYDLVFILGWQVLGVFENGRLKRRNTFLDPSRTLAGIHSHHSWDERQTLPDRIVSPPEELVELLNRFVGVNIVSRRLYELFMGAGLKNGACTLNGVDTEIFLADEPVRREGFLRVGSLGTNKHDWRKGITEYIEPACDLEGVELHLAMPKDGHHIPLDEMPSFYRGIDVYVCASASEGFSLSVLEAAASGCPVISTRVGGCEDLIIDGVNGFLVDRDVNPIREKVKLLRDDRELAKKMGLMNRHIVEQLWSWKVRAHAWLAFIKCHL